MPEEDIHVAVARAFDVLILPPAQWTCFPAGNVPLPPEYAAKLARMGLRRGWPDFLILHGQLYGIELKRRGEKLSRTRLVRTKRGALRELVGQEEVFPKLVAAGMTLAVCNTVEEVLATLRGWAVPMRQAAA